VRAGSLSCMTRGRKSGNFRRVESVVVDETDLAQDFDDVAEEAASRSLAAAVAKAHGVRASVSAQRLLEILTDPDVTLGELSRAIEVDSSLAARVLRVVNSSAYGLRVRVRKISVAVTLLGLKRLNEIATAAAVLDWFEHDSQRVPEIFRHSSATASLARHIATRAGLPPEEMYTCGLLHDYGKLIMMQAVGESYASLVGGEAGDDDEVCARERAIYGYDHAILGARMLAEWNLPEPLPSVISLHHQPARAWRVGGALGLMVAALRLAERLAHEFDRAMPIDDAWVDGVARDENVQRLGLARGDLHRFCLDLHLTWLESQQPVTPDDPTRGPLPAPRPGGGLGRVGEAVAQVVARDLWRAKSIAVAVALVSLAVGCAGTVALLNGRALDEFLRELLGSTSHVLGALALVGLLVAVAATAPAALAAAKRR